MRGAGAGGLPVHAATLLLAVHCAPAMALGHLSPLLLSTAESAGQGGPDGAGARCQRRRWHLGHPGDTACGAEGGLSCRAAGLIAA